MEQYALRYCITLKYPWCNIQIYRKKGEDRNDHRVLHCY